MKYDFNYDFCGEIATKSEFRSVDRFLVPTENSGMEIEQFKKRFGERVRQARRQAGLSQEELAHRIERSSDMISNLERGAASTRIETALRIAEVLDTTIIDLLDVDQIGSKDRQTRDQVNRLLNLVGSESPDFLAALISQVEVLLRVRAERPERK